VIAALGLSQNPVDPARPGRLCRGRERWIDPWEPDGPAREVHRVVVSGAAFTDDSARDAQRGTCWSGLDLASILDSMFPGRTFLAFVEDGHPADIDDDAEDLEAYTGWRAGGRVQEALVRWMRRVQGQDDLRALFREDADADQRIRGLLVLGNRTDPSSLRDPMALLVGMSTLDSPPARFQPMAIPDLVAGVEALVLLHRDKHGPALGVYSREALDVEPAVAALCRSRGVLYVPFAIPPMLARWDRALADLRSAWDPAHGEFPVPASPDPRPWDRRRRRRRADEAPSDDAETPVAAPDEASDEAPDDDPEPGGSDELAGDDDLVEDDDPVEPGDDPEA
jgi:hypothetical protein